MAPNANPNNPARIAEALAAGLPTHLPELVREAPAPASILLIELFGVGMPAEDRRLEISLSNGETVSVAGAYGGYEQYGTYQEHYSLTQPIAERYSKWLNGASLPKPLAKYGHQISTERQPLPVLTEWNTFYYDDKRISWGIEQEGVKYSIAPVISTVTSSLLGYHLGVFGYTSSDGHQGISPNGTVMYGQPALFSRAASAAKVARQVHAKRPA